MHNSQCWLYCLDLSIPDYHWRRESVLWAVIGCPELWRSLCTTQQQRCTNRDSSLQPFYWFCFLVLKWVAYLVNIKLSRFIEMFLSSRWFRSLRGSEDGSRFLNYGVSRSNSSQRKQSSRGHFPVSQVSQSWAGPDCITDLVSWTGPDCVATNRFPHF